MRYSPRLVLPREHMADLPWAVVHHHFWSPLNGAFFTAKDIMGDVRIAHNHVIDAYNGVRVRLSDACLSNPRCREMANTGIDRRETRSIRRDNAIEPEGHAAYWIIKQNTFVNAYAVISTDGSAGHDFLVFGNIFALDNAPGGKCVDKGWAGSRQFRLTSRRGRAMEHGRGGRGRSTCSTQVLGTVIKMGQSKICQTRPSSNELLLQQQLANAKSIVPRSPGAPITSYNNAVEFTGCGTAGAHSCRQVADSDQSCGGTDVWTTDGDAVFAACFPLVERRGGRLPHVMRFNAYNRQPGPQFDGIDTDRVLGFQGFGAAGPAHPLSDLGCSLRYTDGEIVCTGTPATIGAVLSNGRIFDLDLPFGFPFDKINRQAPMPR